MHHIFPWPERAYHWPLHCPCRCQECMCLKHVLKGMLRYTGQGQESRDRLRGIQSVMDFRSDVWEKAAARAWS